MADSVTEARDFLEAVAILRRQMQHEQQLWKDPVINAHQHATDPLDEYERETYNAEAIYRKHIQAAEQAAAAEMRAANLNVFADALESGDYSQLAI